MIKYVKIIGKNEKRFTVNCRGWHLFSKALMTLAQGKEEDGKE